MGILAGVSLMLATLTDTSEIYYQFVSVFSSAFPIVWSQILDALGHDIPETSRSHLNEFRALRDSGKYSVKRVFNFNENGANNKEIIYGQSIY